MQGTGTKNDPYIITTVDELYEMGRFTASSVHYRLGNDINFSGTAYSANYTPVTFRCASFDGAGHCIRNINYNVVSGKAILFYLSCTGNSPSINNLTLENIIICGREVSLFASGDGHSYDSVSCNNCCFSIKAVYGGIRENSETDYCLMHRKNIHICFNLCTLVIETEFLKTSPVFNSDRFAYSQIRLDVRTYDIAETTDVANFIIVNSSFADSYIIGSISRIGNFSDSKPLSLSYSNSAFSNFYTVLDLSNGIGDVYFLGSINSPCFYDRELANSKCSHEFITSSGVMYDLYALTTAQCKNAEYLRSIGFECEEA